MASSWGLSWLQSWGGSWGDTGTVTPPATPADTHDGGTSADDYRRYRRYLKKLEKAAAKFEQSKYTEEIIEAVQDIAAITDVSTPAIQEAAQGETINFDAILAEIAAVKKYIQDVLEYRALLIEIENEQDDEMAILLAIT